MKIKFDNINSIFSFSFRLLEAKLSWNFRLIVCLFLDRTLEAAIFHFCWLKFQFLFLWYLYLLIQMPLQHQIPSSHLSRRISFHLLEPFLLLILVALLYLEQDLTYLQVIFFERLLRRVYLFTWSNFLHYRNSPTLYSRRQEWCLEHPCNMSEWLCGTSLSQQCPKSVFWLIFHQVL